MPRECSGRQKTVLVLGGNGFIGRHAVKALVADGARVVIASRHPDKPGRHLPNEARECARRQARLERLCEPAAWRSLLQGVDTVINCVGILRQRLGERYHDIHCRAPGALAQACKHAGIRLVHVSALGLEHPVRSRFLTSKREGERAIRRVGGDWHLVRPSLVDGDNGYGAHWIRKVANWPLHTLPADARGRIAALNANDLGEALARLALQPTTPSARNPNARIYELGGDTARGMTEQLLAMRTVAPKRLPIQFKLPAWLSRLASHACDLLHVTPYSFGHYELLKYDNVPKLNRLEELLGRPPRAVGKPAGLNTPAGCRLRSAFVHPRPDQI